MPNYLQWLICTLWFYAFTPHTYHLLSMEDLFLYVVYFMEFWYFRILKHKFVQLPLVRFQEKLILCNFILTICYMYCSFITFRVKRFIIYIDVIRRAPHPNNTHGLLPRLLFLFMKEWLSCCWLTSVTNIFQFGGANLCKNYKNCIFHLWLSFPPYVNVRQHFGYVCLLCRAKISCGCLIGVARAR